MPLRYPAWKVLEAVPPTCGNADQRDRGVSVNDQLDDGGIERHHSRQRANDGVFCMCQAATTLALLYDGQLISNSLPSGSFIPTA